MRDCLALQFSQTVDVQGGLPIRGLGLTCQLHREDNKQLLIIIMLFRMRLSCTQIAKKDEQRVGTHTFLFCGQRSQ